MERVIIGLAVAVSAVVGIVLVWPGPDHMKSVEQTSTAARVESSFFDAGAARTVEESRTPALPVDAGAFSERAEAIAAMPRTTEREDSIRSLAHEWAAEDPISAERWAAALEDRADGERALTHVCLEVGLQNPREAIDMARWHKIDQGTVEAIVGQWAGTDFDGAANWVDELPEGEFRANALSRLALARAETAPEEAASMVSMLFAPGTAQEEAAIAVLHQWLHQNPEEARQWVEAFPEGPLKDRARAEVHGTTAYLEDMQADQARHRERP